MRAVILVKTEIEGGGETTLIPLNIYVLMVVVKLSDGPHLCVALEIETRERAELGRATESGAMVGSDHERVGGGSGSCSRGRDHTGEGDWGRGRGNWEGCTWSSTVITRSLRLSPPEWPRAAGRFSVGDDIMDGDCERFFKDRFL